MRLSRTASYYGFSKATPIVSRLPSEVVFAKKRSAFIDSGETDPCAGVGGPEVKSAH